MTLLGTLLKNRKADEAHSAWHRPTLRAPENLTLTSRDFTDGAPMPARQAARNTGGEDVSPHLTWTAPPAGTAQLLLVMEDLDVPLPRPITHCVALIDPSRTELEPGALDARQPVPGVRPLRASIGRGYHGPGPIKGHGPHRYVFQLYALSAPLGDAAGGARPGALLSSIAAPLLGRGRLTGTYERR
ncbi:YbhB/YbcL family Raf kinase inhibitor-like protein [Streptomyces sp. NPDC046716]|uniref:YbhB/YbcL family Raf kinase inhibitor-like protein n=1 Tax=Streptomyces sp. NPDC046716 TaxID=3157093 RepID=UPI0033C185DC